MFKAWTTLSSLGDKAGQAPVRLLSPGIAYHMMPWSRNWVSSAVKRDENVRPVLDHIRRLAKGHRDAGSRRHSRGPQQFFFTELWLFRPNARTFLGLVFLFAGSALAYSWADGRIGVEAWADEALKAVIPIFVLGVSVVTLTRSLSETGKFTGEYLNEACRMPLFCCLTFGAAIMGLMGWLMATGSAFHPLVAVCVAGGSVGAAIGCLCMLAFVIIRTMRCLVPSEAIRVVSAFAAVKLCHAYLKEVYIQLVQSQRGEHLEKWCVEHCKAIHPPSQYYGHYFRSGLNTDKASNSCVILLRKRVPSKANPYKDLHVGRLAELERYLITSGAELYLSSPEYDSERTILGILSCPGVANNLDLCTAVERMGSRAVRFRSEAFIKEGEEFWDSQKNALNEAIERAVARADPVQVRAYLDAVNKPLTVLREARQHRVVRAAYGEYVRREYDFFMLYLTALDEILARQESEPRHRAKRSAAIGDVLRASVWEETRNVLRHLDYHTMELFTWLVPRMYRAIQEAGDRAAPLRGMRAKFGGFYTVADGWLDEAKAEETEAVEKMRLVLHDGLTKWLLMAIEKKDDALVEQLCDTARVIAFGYKGDISFNRGALVASHLVLAGYLIAHAKRDGVDVAAIQRLFSGADRGDPPVNFDDLVAFCRSGPSAPGVLEPYYRNFYTPERETEDLLTGSRQSFGSGTSGFNEMSLAFIYLGACALARSVEPPKPIADDLLVDLSEPATAIVVDVFKGTCVDYSLPLLKKWRDECTRLHEETEAKAIADAPLNPTKVEEWGKDFWKAYSPSSPVLSLYLRNGNYEIDPRAHTNELRQLLPKIAVIDWKYPISGANGGDYARGLARYMQGQLIDRMTDKTGAASRIKGTLSDVMKRAAAWLKKTGCEGEKGLIIAMTKHNPAGVLFSDDSYVPPWKEDAQSRGFEGFYEGFPVVWHRASKEAEEGSQSPKEPRCETVVAVDLRGWKGVKVTEGVITKGEFGQLTIRPWTEQEIQEALDSKKLEPKDINKAKGNCPVDITLYWQLSSSDPPPAQAFEIKPPSQTT